MASILRVNTLTDASSNNSTPMATINQGTAKCWARIADENGSYLDSFNTASLTDSAVGKAVVVFTTAMSNANYSVSLAIGENFSEPNINSTSTANYEVWVYDEGASAYKDVTTHSSVLGDSA